MPSLAKNKSFDKTMHTHRRLFGYALDVRGFIAISALYSFLLTIVVIIQMFSLSILIAHVFESFHYPETSLVLILAASIVARSLLVWLRERHAQKKAAMIKSEIRSKVFDKMLDIGPVITRSFSSGKLIAIIIEGSEKLDDYFSRYIPSIIHIAILPPVIIVFSFSLDWPSGLILFLTGPLILFFMWLIGTHAKKISQDQWSALSSLSSRFLDAIQGLKTLKLFGANEFESRHIETSSDRFRIITMGVLKVAFLSGMVLELAASISIAIVAVQVGIRLIEGMMAFQPGLFMLLLAPEFYLPFRALGQNHHAGMEGRAAADSLFGIIDNTPGAVVPKILPDANHSNISIVCNKLSYTYPGGSSPAIDDLSCIIPPGKLTAIVGPSGSGKSTFINLLLGYILADHGKIIVNGHDLCRSDLEKWRSSIAFVSQHPHFFNGSILDNLLMANQEADMKQLMEATSKSGADQFISALPDAYHTLLSENASRLSGGEKQRLAISRSLIKNAPVIFLDEPTSSLDPESEQLIMRAWLEAVSGRTAVVIAHRLQTVRRADQILVFNKGRIEETGNHEQLIASKGIYYNFLSTLGLNNQ